MKHQLVALTALLLAGFATATVAQDNVTNTDFFLGIEYANETSVSGFKFLDEGTPSESLESKGFAFVSQEIPRSTGFASGYRSVVRASNVDESYNGLVPADTRQVNFRGQMNYTETVRLDALRVFYYSITERWHPFIMAGLSIVAVDVSIKGDISEANNSGKCARGCTTEATDAGTSLGYKYGAGMAFHISDSLTIQSLYEAYVGDDFDFIVIEADGTRHTVGRVGSKFEAWNIGLLFSF